VKPEVKAAIERFAKAERSLLAYVEIVLEEHIERANRAQKGNSR
jgi:hypothetical protein